MKYRNDLKKRVLAGLFAGAALCLAAPAVLAAGSPVANDTLPQLADPGNPFFAGQGYVDLPKDNQMTIHQNSQNAVIKWDSFNVGANATVNFEKGENYNGGDRFNTLNYVNQANGMSQIYGAISAAEGNIYIVNPAGVEIGNSAQINVGSLYVSNKKLDNELENIENKDNPNIGTIMSHGTIGDAVLMSLGNINANTVTFEGNRIVIDTERIKDESGDIKLVDIDNGQNITIRTTNENNVVIGYKGYDEDNNAYNTQDVSYNVTKINDDGSTTAKTVKGYMWVEDVEQLQAIGASADTLDGNYALRNSIDATATQDWNDTFNPLGGTGQDGEDKPFTGKFDGLDYNIFNLNIKKDTDNVGLFGVVGEGAVINNVTLVGGSITGQNNVGALAGSVQGGVHISNITNSASVTGEKNVGGIVGESIGNDSQKTVYENLINTGTITSSGTEDGEGGRISNAGGLIGYLGKGDLGGMSYNLGAVTGRTENDGSMIVGYNVGGLVGKASDATLGDGMNLIYNRLNVSGAYNVGGIVGSMANTTVKNAENSGNVTATGHTTEDYAYHTSHWKDSGGKDKVQKIENVYVANVGGIAGKSDSTSDSKEEEKSKIENVRNSGDVSSSTAKKTTDKGVEYTYYTAGNVGGIVGRAENTNISDATNTENDVRGAHNVGGIAGYFGGKGIIKTGINNGGDILATGAVDKETAIENKIDDSHNNGFVTEWVRSGSEGGEKAIIGNMGGIVGYMDGDNVYITSSANRGTVHSQDIGTEVLPVSQAANAGGIVGKIDRSETKEKNDVIANYATAAVSNSYNTGDVRGYMGVGGVAGMMYNGEIAGSYNLGTVNTTRNKESFTIGDYYAVNMGGVVGDTTEQTEARALLYDVYNKGQIGDETFTYYARHVGGVVGRLSGSVEKAYNTGAIYNGYSIVGGIVGWLNAGSVTNSFNTGNITVLNHDNTEESNVGGIAGDVNIATGNIELTNVYNLGTLRSIRYTAEEGSDDKNGNDSVLGGIVGAIHRYHDNKDGKLLISNAYTTGNLYSDGRIQSIVTDGSSDNYKLTNTYYIHPADTGSFDDLVNAKKDNSNKDIAFADKDQADSYAYEDSEGSQHSLTFTTQGKGSGKVDEGNETTIKADDTNWRIYDGSTPILNAFLPNTEKYFSGETGVTNAMDGIASIQYGTAYDPLLTIIDAGKNTQNLTFDWQKLGVNNAAGIAVYGAGLTLDNFKATGGSGYFGGMIYSDGALSIASESGGNVALGSASQLYGSSVSISADGNVTIYGDVTATGNTQDGTTRNVDENGNVTYKNLKDFKTSGDISIEGGSVDVYGQLTSAKEGKTTFVPGIGSMAAVGSWNPGDVEDPTKPMTDIGDRFGYTTGASTATGSISITANETASEDGHVNVYYGHQQKGFRDTAGDLTVKASGDVYMDSDLSIGGSLSLKAGDNSEVVLDISNIGKVQAEKGTITDALVGLHNFLNHFAQRGENVPSITLDGGETKLAVDMWGDGAFDLTKYDLPGEVGATLADKLDQLHINRETGKGKHYTYIWVSTGEQLAGIQQYKNSHSDSNILTYNFALKNDIDASDVTNYEAIGTGAENGYTGTFDGRDNRIIGLDTTKRTDGKTLTNAGIFDTIGIGKNADGTEQVGTVEDLRVYSGTFTGKDNAGAVAGVNKGNISNVTAFGNVVTAQGSTDSTELGNLTEEGSVHVGAAGGIAGVNYGIIDNASAVGTATAADAEAGSGALSTAGGIAGINMYDENINKDGGIISNSTSNSAVNASKGNAAALGGVAGVNAGELNNVDSLGVTTGVYKGNTTQYSDNVGGIAGIDQAGGTVESAYNESIVSGRNNVGGILGVNTGVSVTDVSNAARVTGEAASDDTSDYVGGLVGSNSGSITNGRNNGEITGSQYVGGLVGNNASGSNLSNLVNDEAASITGDNYVGGIAGRNYGTISANDKGLVNRGSITGQMYVGGVAGSNEDGGIITNTISSIALHVKTPYISGQDESTAPKYFGGVVGQNSGTINGATNESSVDVAADGATMVGGIIGENTKSGKLAGDIANEGLVSGKSNVGGIIGSNENDGILNNTSNNRLVVSNSGRVQAEDGGAAGIFYENTGAINNADLTNTGMVIGGKDAASVTGGLFGMNSGKITNSTLTNTGTVYGGGTVGGLIGKNEGDISTSSLINSVDGKVIGLNNVGGLIGQNYGTITGGRTEKNEQGKDTDVGYYKYQIYNNGTITVGTWTDGSDGSDPDGKIADGEIKTDGVSGSNIGGLVGLNGYDEETGKTGSITAGYNTGAIDAAYSENVGGIAGTNTGKLDQVFNTVITGVGTDGSNVYGSITGGTNVGGIAGTNSGTISDAYNTSAVTSLVDNAVIGSIVGFNDNNGTITNVYGTGTLVGGTNTTVTNGYSTTTEETDWTASGSYGGFDFDSTDTDGTESIWKIYEGSTNPLLKVFLTQLTVNEYGNEKAEGKTLDEYLNLVYNGREQDIDIADLIDKGFITGPQDMKDAEGNSFAFNAYKNTSRGLEESNPFGDSDLLYNTDGQKYAGSYDNWLASEQIEAGGGTVNNLGYDIDFGTLSEGNEINIGKAQIQIGLDTINRVYGNAAIQGTKPAEINGKHFGDDKDYGFTISNDDTGTGLTEGMLKDFENLTMDDLGYEFVSDGALGTGESGKVTNNAGDHTWSANFSLGEDTGETSLAHNYELVGASDQGIVQASGTSHVDRAHLTISANDEQIYVGTKPQFSGTVISDVLVNGDTIFDGSYQYGTEQLPADTSKPGEFDIGIHFDNTYLNDKSPASDWDNVLNGLFKNYNVEFKPGTLTVQDLPEGMPDISDIPSIERHWNFLFDDNPWDRNRDFRERKAEVHFVAGGMTL